MENATRDQEHDQNQTPHIKLVDENIALNVIVSFLSLAQKRGAFSFDESAKIWECIQKFQNH